MKKKLLLGLLICFSMAVTLPAQNKTTNEKANKKTTEVDKKFTGERRKNTEQNRRADLEKLRAKKIAFISEKVQFTPAEAEAFWPVCNELQEKKFQLYQSFRDERRQKKEEEMTEEDYLKLIDTNADIRVKEAQLEKEYLEKFKKILPAKKIYKYQRAEEEFMRQMLPPRDRGGERRPNDAPRK